MNIDDIAKLAVEDLNGLIEVSQEDMALIFEECLRKAEIAIRKGETVNLGYLGTFYVDGDPGEINHVVPTDLLEPWPPAEFAMRCDIGLLDTAIRMARDLRDYVDAGQEAGSKMQTTKGLIEDWEKVYRRTNAVRHCV